MDGAPIGSLSLLMSSPTMQHSGLIVSQSRPINMKNESSIRWDTTIQMQAITLATQDKPHCKAANDMGWEAIQELRERDGAVGLNHFKLIRRLGCGDIGSVYLCELRGTSCYFAMKVMDKGALAIRKKLSRAQTEKEILASLDHPFLPTLYAHFETSQFSCLVMEYCSGGDLHSLRQQQPGKCFNDMATKFYAAEVLLALEYLHMMGVVYRDLKPENVLVREDGHIMLSDFDLSLRCVVSPTLMFPAVITSIESSSSSSSSRNSQHQQRKSIDGFTSLEQPNALDIQSCVPMMMSHKFLHSAIRKKPSFSSPVQEKGVSPRGGGGTTTTTTTQRPELVVEPTEVRSMSFVGTHEYLAPEIISGDGHGSSVDWWTFGIFLYELLYSRTPFKGVDNELTLTKVVSHPLLFPASNATANRVPESAKDLIRGLLVKNPMKRLGSLRGAGEIKSHSFFEGVNWALIRCTVPPQIPKPYKPTEMAATTTTAAGTTKSQLQPAAAAAEAQKENQKANGWRKQESDVSHVVPPHFQYF
ncbi:unnamed protein product [Sphagnum jensenii]|uniref:non-specific serine/threonine protein kinase n=1 Tax=Sphagnum jensenii TaxID=128206 RepID=A0ABP0VNJ1_9BRYO